MKLRLCTFQTFSFLLYLTLDWIL